LSLDHHVGVVGEGIWAFHISRFLMWRTFDSKRKVEVSTVFWSCHSWHYCLIACLAISFCSHLVLLCSDTGLSLQKQAVKQTTWCCPVLANAQMVDALFLSLPYSTPSFQDENLIREGIRAYHKVIIPSCVEIVVVEPHK
jgi:hypothetical protein